MAEEIAIKRIYDLESLTGSVSGWVIALDKSGEENAKQLDLSTFISSLKHNDFGGKQGGVTGEYYHLSAAELANSQLWQSVTGGNINRASGTVGINNTTPDTNYKLDVNGAVKCTSATISSENPNIYITDTNINVTHRLTADSAVGGMSLIVDNNVAGSAPFLRLGVKTISTGMTFDANNNICIGYTVPTEKLDVNGNIKASGILYGNSDQRAALEKNSTLPVESGDILDFTAKTDYKITASAATSFTLTGLTKTDQSFALYFTQDPTTARTLTITYAGKVFGGSGCLTGSGTATITVDVSTTLNKKTKVTFHSEDSTNIWVSVDEF